MKEAEKKIHLDNFKRALLNVAPEYFGIPAIENQIHLNERAFAFELYHQLRAIYNGHNWYANGELRKCLTLLPNYNSTRTLIPDLVVHHFQTTDNNIIAIEIKSNDKVTGPQLISDLTKLEQYTRPSRGFLNYHIGILLAINFDFRHKYYNMSKRIRDRIMTLLGFHRIAIWNIITPVPMEETGSRIRLRENCLRVIKQNDLEP